MDKRASGARNYLNFLEERRVRTERAPQPKALPWRL